MANELDINRLMSQAGAFESFESYERTTSANLSTEDRMNIENDLRKGFTMPQALQKHFTQKKQQAAISLNSGKNAIARACAEFDLNITRSSANLVANGVGVDLPFAMFGVLDTYSNYSGAIALQVGGALPSGLAGGGQTILVSVAYGGQCSIPQSVNAANVPTTSLAGGYANSLVFTYWNGLSGSSALYDTIAITCNQIPYPSFLQRMVNGLFRVSKVRYQLITDNTSTVQFSKGMYTYYKSMFGKLIQEQVSVGAYKDPKQFQNGIIDLDINVSLNPCTSLTNSFSGVMGSYPYTITLSGFVEELDHGTNSILI